MSRLVNYLISFAKEEQGLGVCVCACVCVKIMGLFMWNWQIPSRLFHQNNSLFHVITDDLVSNVSEQTTLAVAARLWLLHSFQCSPFKHVFPVLQAVTFDIKCLFFFSLHQENIVDSKPGSFMFETIFSKLQRIYLHNI